MQTERQQSIVRVALCGKPSLDELDLPGALEASARRLSLPTPQIDRFASAIDLIDACKRVPEGALPFDLVVSETVLPGISGTQMTRELAAADLVDDGLRVVLLAADERHVREAATVGAYHHLILPLSPERLVDELSSVLAAIVAERPDTVVLRCREGMRRVRLSSLTYVETSGRDQLVHRIGERTPLAVKCSSRAIFAEFEHDSRLFKVGSSYIVNLDHAETLSLRGGSVALRDGSTVAVPVRLRKPLADALCEHAAVTL